MNNHARKQQILVSRKFIEKNRDDRATYAVPSVTTAPVSKRVALYHLSMGRPVVAMVAVDER